MMAYDGSSIEADKTNTLKRDSECGRLTETLLNDTLRCHLGLANICDAECLFALSKFTLRRLGKSDYRARPRGIIRDFGEEPERLETGMSSFDVRLFVLSIVRSLSYTRFLWRRNELEISCKTVPRHVYIYIYIIVRFIIKMQKIRYKYTP